MPRLTDKSDANTLPDPELNPLLNPVLAAHMGRWAEVYFTSPPEKRGQAVSELLRELRDGSPLESASVQVTNDEKSEKESETAEAAESSLAAAESLRICGVCAQKNLAWQRFCGMCGAALQVSPDARLPQVAEAVPISAAPNPGGHNALEAAWTLPEKSLPHLGVESGFVPYRHRFYVGVVLAVLLAILAYKVSRGTKAISDTAGTQSALSRTIPPAPLAAAAQQPPRSPARPGVPCRKESPASPVRSTNQPAATSRRINLRAHDLRPGS